MVDHNVHYFSNDHVNKINLCCNASQIYLLCCRLPDQALQQRQRLKEAPSEQLYPSLDSLNQLGSIPWQVNTPVSILKKHYLILSGHNQTSKKYLLHALFIKPLM